MSIDTWIEVSCDVEKCDSKISFHSYTIQRDSDLTRRLTYDEGWGIEDNKHLCPKHKSHPKPRR